MATKQTLTKAEYLQVVGLLTLAAKHDAVMKDIVASLGSITGEDDPDMGHCADAVWGDHDADELLRKLRLAVDDE